MIIFLCLVASVALLSSSLLGKQDENVTSPNPAPQVTLTADPTEGVPPLTVTFTAEAVDVDLKLPEWAKDKTFQDTASIEEEVDGVILSYEWSGAVSGSGKSITETFDNEGTYTATVTVKCDDDESATASVTVTVNCRAYQLAYGEAQRDVAIAYQEVEEARAEVKRLEGEVKKALEKGKYYAWLCANSYNPVYTIDWCHKAAKWRLIWEEKTKELNEAKQTLKQKKKERKEAIRRAKEAWEAWQRCKGTDHPFRG